MIETYKQHFGRILSQHMDLPLEDILIMIEIPPENIPGDLAFPCFGLAKQLKANPNAIAKEFAEKFSDPSFSKFEAI
jgi:arginyl-tRNA synthetase